MNTEKLYYEDAYMKEFDAEVTDVYSREGRIFVVLDRTAFYPEGGGQTGDSGRLYLRNGEQAAVMYTTESGDSVEHEISPDGAVPVKGETVKGVIDWEKRFDHMQQHSGEHIVSGLICRRFGCDNVGFHMGKDTVVIDFNARISMEDLLQIEKEANAYISEDHDFVSMLPSEEELKKLDYRSKKQIEGSVRIAYFPGADMCACCGTHVSGSAQVGLVKIASAESFHGGTRVELRFGKRAFDNLALNYTQNRAIGALLSAREDRTAEYVKKQADELAETRYRLNMLEEEMMDLIAEKYKDKGDTLYITSTHSPEYVRKLAAKISAESKGLAAVYAGEGGNYKYALSGPADSVPELNKKMTEALDGRGGGRNGFAQGSVNASESRILEFWNEKILIADYNKLK